MATCNSIDLRPWSTTATFRKTFSQTQWLYPLFPGSHFGSLAIVHTHHWSNGQNKDEHNWQTFLNTNMLWIINVDKREPSNNIYKGTCRNWLNYKQTKFTIKAMLVMGFCPLKRYRAFNLKCLQVFVGRVTAIKFEIRKLIRWLMVECFGFFILPAEIQPNNFERAMANVETPTGPTSGVTSSLTMTNGVTSSLT